MFRTTFLCQYVDMSDRNVIYIYIYIYIYIFIYINRNGAIEMSYIYIYIYIYILYILFTYFRMQDFLTDTSLLIIFLLEKQIHYSFVP